MMYCGIKSNQVRSHCPAQMHSLKHWAIDAGYTLAGVTLMVCACLVL